MRKDVREFIRRLEAAGLTVESTPGHYRVLRDGKLVRRADGDGVPPEYAAAARRYLGEEAAGTYLEQIDRPGTRMARIDLRPGWVGVHDFQSRLPSALGGIARE